MPKHPGGNCQDSFPCLSLKHPTTNWASPNRSPALQRADKKGALPHRKEVPLAPLSTLQRADKRESCLIARWRCLPHCPPFEGRGTMRSMVVGCLIPSDQPPVLAKSSPPSPT